MKTVKVPVREAKPLEEEYMREKRFVATIQETKTINELYSTYIQLDWRIRDIVELGEKGEEAKFLSACEEQEDYRVKISNRLVSIAWRVLELELPVLLKGLQEFNQGYHAQERASQIQSVLNFMPHRCNLAILDKTIQSTD